MADPRVRELDPGVGELDPRFHLADPRVEPLDPRVGRRDRNSGFEERTMKQDNMPQVARFWNDIAQDFDAIYTGKNKSAFARFLVAS